MRELTLIEVGEPVIERLDPDTVSSLLETSALSVLPVGNGHWELRAKQKVGVLSVGDLVVRIRPKVPISRLLWMMGWAGKDVFTDEGTVGLAPEPDLVPALAEAYAVQLERALLPGLIHGYSIIESAESVLRGRLRISDQVRENFGSPIPFLVTYDDLSVNTPEHQILKAATSTLLQLPGVSGSVRQRLHKLRIRFSDVFSLTSSKDLPSWRKSRLNTRYHDALDLAEIVLRNGSFDLELGGVRVTGFLIDLFQVFENFVTANLIRYLEQIGGRCTPQDHYTLDSEGSVNIYPDLVWRIERLPAAVIDAKYKAETSSGFPQADIYQALSYSTAYGLPRADLIYAKGGDQARKWSIRNTDIEVRAHTLDLELQPEEILAQIRTLAGEIAERPRKDARALPGTTRAIHLDRTHLQ